MPARHLLIATALLNCSFADAADRAGQTRARMVEDYIESEGIDNEKVLRAMRTVPRHEFVSARLQNRAYNDEALPIGAQQTISPPFVVAYMTETLDPQPTDRVLEIGTGSGYQAAVLAEIVDEVYSIEIVSVLGKAAKKKLDELGYANVHTRVGDGYKGWPAKAPFDKIIVTCSPESVPQPLIDQLREGGRMIIPLGQRYQQVFHLFEKSNGKLVSRKLIPTLFVPMTGVSEKRRNVRPDPLRPRIVNGSFEYDENDDGRVDNWHYQRQTEIVAGESPTGRHCVLFSNAESGRISQMLQGTAVDGRKIASLRLTLWAHYEDLVAGELSSQQPCAMVHFYDATRREVGLGVAGPWRGSLGWHRIQKNIAVPQKAREMIVRVGLNGATGKLWIDDLSLRVRPR